MVSEGEPLTINGEETTWLRSIGFIGVLFMVGIAGEAACIWGLHVFRKGLACSESRIENGKDSGNDS